MTRTRKTVAILGSSGFLGSWLAALFLNDGWDVNGSSRRSLVLRSAGAEVDEDDASTLRHRKLDLSRPESVALACEGADLVIVVVADRTSGTWRVTNKDQARKTIVQIPVTVAEIASRAESPFDVLFAASISQSIGSTDRGDYQDLKLEGEDVLLNAAQSSGFNGSSLRLSTVYGPSRSGTGQDRGLVSSLIRQAMSSSDLPLWNDGTPMRDLIYVKDAAAAFLAAAESAARLTGEHWDVVSGTRRSVSQIFDDVARRVAMQTGSRPVDIVRASPPEKQTQADSVSIVGDRSRFCDSSGWTPRWSWESGLEETITSLLLGQSDAIKGVL